MTGACRHNARIRASVCHPADGCCFRVSLWARFLDGTDLYYSDLLCEGVVTKLLSAYNACDESTWPV